MLALLLAGCGSAASAPDASAHDASIACALNGAGEWRQVCTIELANDEIVIHHPDGGFRRLAITASGFEAADGAETLKAKATGDMVEIAIGADRYRIPERHGE